MVEEKVARMHQLIRGRVVALTLTAAALGAVGLSACGSGSSGEAKTLLQQTFGGHHRVQSGNLSFNLTVNPTGSSTLTTPITISFAGPFQSLGAGKLPQSNFTVSLSGLGKSGSLGLVSTGQNGFVTLAGASYQLPAATFQKLESSFSGLTSSGSGGSGAGSVLAKLGIDPLRWLVNPSIAGNESVGGAQTTHIKAGVNVAALLGDLNTFLQKASSLGLSTTSGIPTSISAATKAKIANEIRNPRFDVWTGTSDKTPRKLVIALTLPVTGQISTLLGGLRSADIALTMEYANLNQPQTITAPSNLRPFSEFTAKLKGIEQAIQGAVGGTLGGTAGVTSSSSGTATSATPTTQAPTNSGAATTSTPANVRNYSQCIQAAGTDVSKMQSCAALLQAK
jgi:hypothetical protein